MSRIIAVVLAILPTFTTNALNYAIPPVPPVDWASHMDTRFTPPVEKVIVDAASGKKMLDDTAMEGYWAAWGISALPHLQDMLHTLGWAGYESQITRIFYRCPFEGALDVQREELLKPADRAAEALKKHETDRGAVSQVSNHLGAGAGKKPELVSALLDHPDPWIRFRAASHLVEALQSIPPEVESILAAFSQAEAIPLQSYAVSLLQKAPTEANLARAALLRKTLEANKARHAAYWETIYANTPEAAQLRGTIVDAQGKPLPGVTLSFAIRRYDNDLEEYPQHMTGTSDAEGRFQITASVFGEATVRNVRVRRHYAYGNMQDNVDEVCTLLNPVAPLAVMPGSRVDLTIAVAVPEVTFIAGTITDEKGVGLKPSWRIFSAHDSSAQANGMPFGGQFLFYALPAEPFAIEFSLYGHQTRILQVDRDFKRGDQTISVVLPTTPYPEDIPIWTTVTGTPWTQENVDETMQGLLIRRGFDNYLALMDQPCPDRNLFAHPEGPVPVKVRMLEGPGDHAWVTLRE